VKGAVLTAKHGCGHLLWPTNVTFADGSPYTYCVGKEGSAIKEDVLALFSASMAKANITHGFYYSFTNNFYMNVRSHVAGHSKVVLPGQVNVTQEEFEAIALGQVR
jgi:alpha-L-fucosidase